MKVKFCYSPHYPDWTVTVTGKDMTECRSRAIKELDRRAQKQGRQSPINWPLVAIEIDDQPVKG
jgi:hypothetical protein